MAIQFVSPANLRRAVAKLRSAATQSEAGLMSAADKKKLDGVPSSAFLAAHPVGSFYQGKSSPASYGGTWSLQPNCGRTPWTWKRTA